MISDIGALQEASSQLFSKPDFRYVRWAGVFGSFARGEHTDRSDVDVLILRKKPYKVDNPSTHLRPLYLEDELPKVCGRKVDVIEIDDDEFRGYFSIESLLLSRTIFGSPQDEELLRLRSIAREILNSCIAKLIRVFDAIQKTRSTVANISVQEFSASSRLRTDIKADILSILDDIDVQPEGHSMYDAFEDALIEPAMALRQEIETSESKDNTPDSEAAYWTLIWEIAATDRKGGLQELTSTMDFLVFPVLDWTQSQNELARKSELEFTRSIDDTSTARLPSEPETWVETASKHRLSIARAQSNLIGAKSALAQVKQNVAMFAFDAKKFQAAEPGTLEYMARSALRSEMSTVVKTLKHIKDPVLLDRYRSVFKDLDELCRQRNVLNHEYGRLPVHWGDVWKTIEEKYPVLEVAIDDAIIDIEETIRRLKAADKPSASYYNLVNRLPNISST